MANGQSPDLLLVVGADVTAFNRQIEQLQRALNVRVDFATPINDASQAAQRLTTGLNAANQQASTLEQTTAKVQQRQRQLARDIEAQMRFQRNLLIDQGRAIEENEARMRRFAAMQSRALQENEA